MFRKHWQSLGFAVCILGFVLGVAWAQQNNQQDIPDAPSAAQPPAPFPNGTAPAPKEQPAPEAPAADQPAAPETPTPVTRVPASEPNSREDLFTITKQVNFVLVPVTVKDESDRLVNGLLPKDFKILENGQEQKMTFFTSDPFPLSAAVVLDLGMQDSDVQKVNQTFSALQGAFSQFDEVSLYTYSSTVSQVKDFGVAGQQLAETLGELKTKRGRNDGPPVLGGPFGAQGPTVNNTPVGQPVAPMATAPKEAHVINDAILMAAVDLNKRERTRRKIIFVISNGREYGSKASYSDVLKVLQTNNITVYGLGMGTNIVPGLKKLQRLHIPRLGTDDILPKYASATGGEILAGNSRKDIDDVYAQAIGDARNQYTIGYNTKAAPGAAYRDIEVVVARPDCSTYHAPCVRTYAKAGYYPVPPVPVR